MNAVDTNVLIYGQDPRDPIKQKIARQTINNLQNGVLIWQVACEYLWASRKLLPYGYNQQNAFADLRDFQIVWKPILPTWEILNRAEDLLNRYSVSFWDGLIIAACIENGVTTLYTEDIADNFRKEGLEIINPF